jgi:predicted nucleic acid-binding protein
VRTAGVARLWRLQDVELVTSNFGIEEARRNLPDAERIDRLASLLEQVRVIEATMPDPASRSEIDLPDKDWPIIGGAIAARATHLITGDARDFGRWFGRKLFGILVLTPGQYLRTVRP